MPRNYWMLTITPENLRVTRDLGFTVQGFTTVSRKKVERMEVGDRLLFYITVVQRFPASATVSSTFFQDQLPLWKSNHREDLFSHRVHIKPEVVLEERDYMDAREIGPRLEYVKKWIPEQWPLAFIGELHLIPKKDFALLEDEMQKIAALYWSAHARV